MMHEWLGVHVCNCKSRYVWNPRCEIWFSLALRNSSIQCSVKCVHIISWFLNSCINFDRLLDHVGAPLTGFHWDIYSSPRRLLEQYFFRVLFYHGFPVLEDTRKVQCLHSCSSEKCKWRNQRCYIKLFPALTNFKLAVSRWSWAKRQQPLPNSWSASWTLPATAIGSQWTREPIILWNLDSWINFIDSSTMWEVA